MRRETDHGIIFTKIKLVDANNAWQSLQWVGPNKI